MIMMDMHEYFLIDADSMGSERQLFINSKSKVKFRKQKY